MSDFANYKLVKLLASEPLGDGGRVLNDNFRALADRSSGYTHVQALPSKVWVIAHGLGKPVNVMIADDTGDVVYGDLHVSDMNTVIATFSQSIVGHAYVV